MCRPRCACRRVGSWATPRPAAPTHLPRPAPSSPAVGGKRPGEWAPALEAAPPAAGARPPCPAARFAAPAHARPAAAPREAPSSPPICRGCSFRAAPSVPARPCPAPVSARLSFRAWPARPCPLRFPSRFGPKQARCVCAANSPAFHWSPPWQSDQGPPTGHQLHPAASLPSTRRAASGSPSEAPRSRSGEAAVKGLGWGLVWGTPPSGSEPRVTPRAVQRGSRSHLSLWWPTLSLRL